MLEPIYESEAAAPAAPPNKNAENQQQPVPSTEASSPYRLKTCCNDGRPNSGIIKFRERNFWNKIGRVLYILLNMAYVSFWFYWGGFIVPFASYIYPYRQAETAKLPDYGKYASSESAGKKDAQDQRGFKYTDFIVE